VRPNLPTNSKIDGGVKVTGILAITCNAFFVFGILALEFQSGGHGEMANFYANSKRREEVPQVGMACEDPSLDPAKDDRSWL
jgi:hypothetical protein